MPISHPKYVESVIQNMADNGTDAEKDLAKELKRAMARGQLDYSVVKAKVNGSGSTAEYGDFNEKHFDMSL